MSTNVPCQIIQRQFGLVFVPFFDPPPNVFITVQHCGLSSEVFVNLFQERGPGSVTDLLTLPLAMDIFRSASPHVGVIYNQFSRRYVETNVEPEDGYSDPRLAPYYNAFHQEIDNRLAEAARAYGPCLLLDLHGFAGQPSYAPPDGYDVILGTDNRATVRHTQSEYSVGKKDDLDYRLTALLEKSGLSVFCPEREPLLEKQWREKVARDFPRHEVVPRNFLHEEEVDGKILEPPSLPDRYNGGYLVREHARHIERVAAAIQIELAYPVRDRPKTGNPKKDAFVQAVTALIDEICS